MGKSRKRVAAGKRLAQKRKEQAAATERKLNTYEAFLSSCNSRPYSAIAADATSCYKGVKRSVKAIRGLRRAVALRLKRIGGRSKAPKAIKSLLSKLKELRYVQGSRPKNEKRRNTCSSISKCRGRLGHALQIVDLLDQVKNDLSAR